MRPRLGVNIDHVATLRQQRGESYPAVERAAEIALKAGADQMTIHLREDFRHIQPFDLPLVKKICTLHQRPLNLELSCSPVMRVYAQQLQPEWICLVPENRQERTTEGGLAVFDKSFEPRLKEALLFFKQELPQTKISLFVEADKKVLEWCCAQKEFIHAVEIHTGDYAKAYLEKKDLLPYLNRYAVGAKLLKAHQLGYHAGHGLTSDSLKPLLKQNAFEEYNIGHWIISEALFKGLETVVSELKDLCQQA
jgi:pyridoxine 5-phosphate synthase